jgi:hypothetical protein
VNATLDKVVDLPVYATSSGTGANASYTIILRCDTPHTPRLGNWGKTAEPVRSTAPTTHS